MLSSFLPWPFSFLWQDVASCKRPGCYSEKQPFKRAPSRWGGHAVGLPTVDLDAMASHLKQGHYHCGLKKGHYSLCGTNLAGESLGMVWADMRGQS